jgi:hypothetical protein
LIVAVLGACGGDSGPETVVKTVTQSEPPATEQSTTDESAAPSSDASCEEQGINSEERNEGTCTDNGVRYTVVNKDSMVRIPEVSARLVSIEQVKTLSSDIDTLTANGIYVIFRVAVKNRLNVPTAVEEGQFVLVVNDKNYTENFDAENGVVEDSFVWQSDDLQPGETRTGALVFDIPTPAAGEVERVGNLSVVPFSEVGYSERPTHVGSIRLYE